MLLSDVTELPNQGIIIGLDPGSKTLGVAASDSLQLTATRKVATPVDWKAGGSCMVVPGVKQEDTAGLFPKGVKVPFAHQSDR